MLLFCCYSEPLSKAFGWVILTWWFLMKAQACVVGGGQRADFSEISGCFFQIIFLQTTWDLNAVFPSFYDSDSPPSQPLYKSQSTPPSDCWLPHLFLCSLHSGLTKNALREVTDDHILAKCCEDILFLTFSVALPPCWNPTFSCLAPVTQPIWFSCCLCDFPGCQSF